MTVDIDGAEQRLDDIAEEFGRVEPRKERPGDVGALSEALQYRCLERFVAVEAVLLRKTDGCGGALTHELPDVAWDGGFVG